MLRGARNSPRNEGYLEEVTNIHEKLQWIPLKIYLIAWFATLRITSSYFPIK